MATWIWTCVAAETWNTPARSVGPINFNASAIGGSSLNPFFNSKLSQRAEEASHAATHHGPPARVVHLAMAHGVLACLAWAFIFPLGGILIRVCSFPNLLCVHAWLQITGMCLYTAAVGIGIHISTNPEHWRFDNKHVIIGMIIYILFLFQAMTGWMHHVLFKKYGCRSGWSLLHLWFGRICITLGMINAGLGFMIRSQKIDNWKAIVYTVFAVQVWVAYMGSAAFGEWRKNQVKEIEETTLALPAGGTSAESSGVLQPEESTKAA